MGVKIQEADLLGFVNVAQNPFEINNGLNDLNNNSMNNFQLGMVQTFFPSVDPMLSSLLSGSSTSLPVYSGLSSTEYLPQGTSSFIEFDNTDNLPSPALFPLDDLVVNKLESTTSFSLSPTSLRFGAKFYT